MNHLWTSKGLWVRAAVVASAACFYLTVHVRSVVAADWWGDHQQFDRLGEKCTPPAEEYFGTLLPDGKCHPLKKSAARFFDRKDDCTPELKGRGVMVLGLEKCELPLKDQIGSECTPPADQYEGMLTDNGQCFPLQRCKTSRSIRGDSRSDSEDVAPYRTYPLNL